MLSPGFVSLLGFVLFVEAIFALNMSSVSKQHYEDASVVTWAHAVNGHQALEAELEGPIDFLEADISLGHVSGNEVGPPIPIMAHPPDVISDISLERWLDIVIARQSGKGIKLDFKSIDIVEPSLQILQRHKGKLHFPLWLNADILPGPVNAHATPVLAEKFLALCEEYFPNATLSVGWTTYWFQRSLLKKGYYSWKHVREMADTLKCFANANSTPVTFPVRGIFASRSITQLTWLLEVFPFSTLTVWSGKFDPLKVEDLIKIRESFPKSRVFYDIPEKIGSQFREKKRGIELKSPEEPTFADHNYVKVSKSKRIQTPTCSSHTYITGRNIMFGKESETLVLLKETFSVTESTPLIAQGEVTFFGNDSPTPSNEQPELILALAEVKSFSKNLSSQLDGASEDDTNVSWVALNSSQLHVFRKEEPSEDMSCHFFRLDTTAKKPFQAWTVNCDQWQENSTAGLSTGTPEVSSKKILILPPGPLVFGVISTGGVHVVVNNLMVKGMKSASSDSGASSPMCFKVIFLCILLACFSLLYSYSIDLHLGPTL